MPSFSGSSRSTNTAGDFRQNRSLASPGRWCRPSPDEPSGPGQSVGWIPVSGFAGTRSPPSEEPWWTGRSNGCCGKADRGGPSPFQRFRFGAMSPPTSREREQKQFLSEFRKRKGRPSRFSECGSDRIREEGSPPVFQNRHEKSWRDEGNRDSGSIVPIRSAAEGEKSGVGKDAHLVSTRRLANLTAMTCSQSSKRTHSRRLANRWKKATREPAEAEGAVAVVEELEDRVHEEGQNVHRGEGLERWRWPWPKLCSRR